MNFGELSIFFFKVLGPYIWIWASLLLSGRGSCISSLPAVHFFLRSTISKGQMANKHAPKIISPFYFQKVGFVCLLCAGVIFQIVFSLAQSFFINSSIQFGLNGSRYVTSALVEQAGRRKLSGNDPFYLVFDLKMHWSTLLGVVCICPTIFAYRQTSCADFHHNRCAIVQKR
jgi:hypothetical protein